ERVRIQLASGVRWDRLTRSTDPNVEHFYVVYEPGGASCDPNALMRHPGYEYGYVLSGRLEVALGLHTNRLGTRALAPDETRPAHVHATGDEQLVRREPREDAVAVGSDEDLLLDARR